jgi:hypothetical protein
MRAQIFANALVLFPRIVQQHNEEYPTIPLRAQDIFEITISLREDYGMLDYTTRLTYRRKLAPALHILLLGSASNYTAHLALLDLLNTSCTMLATDQKTYIIGRPPNATAVHSVMPGSHEGARTVEMQLARDIVTQLRERIRSAEADSV